MSDLSREYVIIRTFLDFKNRLLFFLFLSFLSTTGVYSFCEAKGKEIHFGTC